MAGSIRKARLRKKSKLPGEKLYSANFLHTQMIAPAASLIAVPNGLKIILSVTAVARLTTKRLENAGAK
jgi:hypothetical protein